MSQHNCRSLKWPPTRIRFRFGGFPVGLFLLSFLLVQLTGCATFYEQNSGFQQQLQTGDYEAALGKLEKSVKKAPARNRLLMLLQQGTTLRSLGRFAESNAAFEEAYLFTEDERGSKVAGVASLVTNPGLRTYLGEDWERMQIHYFKALNHLDLGQLDDALVEARRLVNRQNQLDDERGDSSKRYRRDAFAYMLMGLLFELDGDPNRAFISYRNAWETYEEDYAKLFSITSPAQLKLDLLRTARQSGMTEEWMRLKELFALEEQAFEAGKGELILLWNNGLGPVKDAFELNFIFQNDGDGFFFVNEELGLSIPFSGSDEQAGHLSDLRVVRVALPRYQQREAQWASAELQFLESGAQLEILQDISALATLELKQRWLKDLGEALLRLALKQSAEQALREQNAWLGLLASLFNASTEAADTRNWQTLPHTISYTRLQLPAGQHELNLRLFSEDGLSTKDVPLVVDIDAGRRTIRSVDSPQCRLPSRHE